MPATISPLRPAVTVCDCGHAPSPDKFSSGYAVNSDTGKTLCYQCAAEVDREYAKTMAPTDPALFAYIRGVMPAAHSSVEVTIVTWPGVQLGTGRIYRGDRYNKQLHVVATIDGRRFHGRSPAESGTYVRLRPYRDQKRNH